MTLQVQENRDKRETCRRVIHRMVHKVFCHLSRVPVI